MNNMLDYIAEGFWHTDPDIIISMVRRHQQVFTKEEKEFILSHVYRGLGNHYHDFKMVNGKIECTSKRADEIDAAYKEKYDLKDCDTKDLIDSMNKNKSTLSPIELARLEDIERPYIKEQQKKNRIQALAGREFDSIEVRKSASGDIIDYSERVHAKCKMGGALVDAAQEAIDLLHEFPELTSVYLEMNSLKVEIKPNYTCKDVMNVYRIHLDIRNKMMKELENSISKYEKTIGAEEVTIEDEDENK